MSLTMTPEDICKEYRTAKSPLKQIGVLAELNACPKGEIIQVLRDNGEKLPGNVGPRSKPAPDLTPGDVNYWEREAENDRKSASGGPPGAAAPTTAGDQEKATPVTQKLEKLIAQAFGQQRGTMMTLGEALELYRNVLMLELIFEVEVGKEARAPDE